MVGCNCDKPYTSRDKWVVSLMAGILFILFASPFFISALNGITSPLIGLDFMNQLSCPNIGGVVFAGILYMLLVRVLMK